MTGKPPEPGAIFPPVPEIVIQRPALPVMKLNAQYFAQASTGCKGNGMPVSIHLMNTAE